MCGGGKCGWKMETIVCEQQLKNAKINKWKFWKYFNFAKNSSSPQGKRSYKK